MAPFPNTLLRSSVFCVSPHSPQSTLSLRSLRAVDVNSVNTITNPSSFSFLTPTPPPSIMSNPIPSPPPLPPPTVPSYDPLPHPPPPLPQNPPITSAPTLSDLVQQSSPSHSSPPHSSSSSESPSPSPSKSSPMHQSEHSRSCCLPKSISLCPTPHHLQEPATSFCLPPPILLIFRLAATAILISHLLFFSLRGDFSYRLYSTWNYVGLSLAFFLVLITTLLHVLRDEQSVEQDHFSPTQGEGMITDVERQPLGPAPLPDPKLARALTCIAVPLYFIFVTATLFATAVYWAAIHPTAPDSLSFSYPLIILKVFAPAVALLDFFFTLRMRFRFLYVLLYTLYNAIYVAALVTFDKLHGDPVYALFDPSVQSTNQFIIKTASIAASSIAAALIMYALSYLPAALSSCFTGKSTPSKSKQPHTTNHASDDSGTTASDTTSESSPTKSPHHHQVHQKSSDNTDPLKLTRNEEARIRMTRSSKKNDRMSLPITATASISPSTSANRFRSSSARFATSNSTSSIGSHGTHDSYSRSDSEKRSSWQQMEQPAPQIEDEYFAMPSAFGESEKVKLIRPMPRTESGSSLPGLLSRSGSGRMVRSESNRLSRSGSKTFFVRSSSDRAVARRSFTRSNSAASMR